MSFKLKLTCAAAAASLAIAWLLLPHLTLQDAWADHHDHEGAAMTQYLVKGSGGPGLGPPEEAVKLLEGLIIPSLKLLAADKKVLAGGLPVGARAVVFIIEAASNDEADKFIRGLPAWHLLKWKVTALQSFAGRAAMEAGVVKQMKADMK